MSPTVASLIVSLVSLFGVIVTTWWNNKKADERRREDQKAEDNRRKSDEDYRERIRLERLREQDRSRQRLAIADCIRGIQKSAALVARNTIEEARKSKDFETAATIKATELESFLEDATSRLSVLSLEITEPYVRAQYVELWDQFASELSEIKRAREKSSPEWLACAANIPPLSDRSIRGIEYLLGVARVALLEQSEKSAEVEVKPISLDEKDD